MFVATDRPNTVQYVPTPDSGPSQHRLDAGVYRTSFDNMGTLFFHNTRVSDEQLIDLDTDPARRIQREIDRFFDPIITARLMDAHLKHRRAILLYGPAGTGKTSLVRGMFPAMLAYDAIVLLEPDISAIIGRIIPAIRLTDTHRPVVLVFDEFHSIISNGVARVLQLLDGLQSPEHMMFIGTTNYINRVPKPLRERPSRFSLLLEIDKLPRSARVQFAQNKYPMLDTTLIEELVDLTDVLALDYLEEVCRLSLTGDSVAEIRDRLNVIDTKAAVLKAEEEDSGYEN